MGSEHFSGFGFADWLEFLGFSAASHFAVLALEKPVSASGLAAYMLAAGAFHAEKCRQHRQAKTIVKTFTRWEFPKIWGTLFWVPYNKDPTT